METQRSEQLYASAKRAIPGGVNSPSRAFAAVGGGAPRYMTRGEGAYLWDADGNRYIDYLAAYGALVLGHSHPVVVAAVRGRLSLGTVYGTPHPLEIELAERLMGAIPAVARLRFTCSGTEAVMSAIRVARAFTGRELIVKFAGSYHGHADPVLTAAGSGTSTLGLDESAGLPEGVKRGVISLPYNDLAALRALTAERGGEIAALLLEPVVGNFGMIPPAPGFLRAAQRLVRSAGGIVIWDEVITAFRFGWGSVAPLLEVPQAEAAELTTLGKLIGGGLPIGAYGGRADVMAVVAPEGPVYQDGTFAGNPLSMASGLACLQALADDRDVYPRLERFAMQLCDAAQHSAQRHGVPIFISRVGGAFSIQFTPEAVRDFAAAQRSSSARYAAFFHGLLRRGVLTAPSKYEAWFVSAVHSAADIARTCEAIDGALGEAAATPA